MISEFFFQIAELKKLPRSGWKIKVGLEDSESVAEHSYMMSVMSMVLSDMKSLNSEKVLKMAILHDWAESKIGDFMPEQIGYEKKSELENYAMSEILESLPQKIQEDYTSIWNEFLVRDTPESKIGDFMPEQIGYDKKSELENYAMSEILESLPQKIQEDYTNIWNEFLVRDTPESKLVHELDKLEMALQAKIYEKDTDPEKVKPFIISAVEQIMDPDVKKILMDILK